MSGVGEETSTLRPSIAKSSSYNERRSGDRLHHLEHLREENTRLVSQSRSLVSDLEDTSQQLRLANDKVNRLERELRTQPPLPPPPGGGGGGGVGISRGGGGANTNTSTSTATAATTAAAGKTLDAQVKALQERMTESAGLQMKVSQLNVQQRAERAAWEAKQRAFRDQLGDVQEECRRLREACSLAEERASENQSNEWSKHSTPPSFSRHPPPLASSSLLLLNKDLSGSTNSLASVRSTQSAIDIPIAFSSSSSLPATYHHRTRPAYHHRHHQHHTPPGLLLPPPPPSSSSSLSPQGGRGGGGGASAVVRSHLSVSLELERTKSRVRQLDKEVRVLEQQLSDKTRAGREHVEELSKLRAQLGRERSALAQVRQEERRRAMEELSQVKQLQANQCSEFESQVERVRQEKASLDQEVGRLRGSLKVSKAENNALQERIATLTSHLEKERQENSAMLGGLQLEVERGRSEVTRMEKALSSCGSELTEHLCLAQANRKQQREETDQLRKKIEEVSAELEGSQRCLAEKTKEMAALRGQLQDAGREAEERKESWRVTEAELRDYLEQSESMKYSLLQQLEASGRDLSLLRAQLEEGHQALAELQQSQAEVATLQQALKELQRRGVGMEESRKEGEGRLRGEVLHLRAQLKEAREGGEGAREEGRRKGEEVRALEGRLKQCREQLVSCESEVSLARADLKKKEREVDESTAQMQQELAKRAQQVMELDKLLRSHQADTTARRLQLERTLSQRQADLRSRTQDLEELMTKSSETEKVVEQLREQVKHFKASGDSAASHNIKKDSEIAALRSKLQEAGVESALLRSKASKVEEQGKGRERREAGLQRQLEALQKRCGQLEKERKLLDQEKIQAKLDRSQLAQQLASREDQLRRGEALHQEELSRCRAQVTSLSAELAAEQRIAEEARRQAALARHEAAGQYHGGALRPQLSDSLLVHTENTSTAGAGAGYSSSSSSHGRGGDGGFAFGMKLLPPTPNNYLHRHPPHGPHHSLPGPPTVLPPAPSSLGSANGSAPVPKGSAARPPPLAPSTPAVWSSSTATGSQTTLTTASSTGDRRVIDV